MGFFITTPELKASYKAYLKMYTNEQTEYNQAAFQAFKDRLKDRISEEEFNQFTHEIHCEDWFNECSRTLEIFMDKDEVKDYVYGEEDMDYVGTLYDLDKSIRNQSIQF